MRLGGVFVLVAALGAATAAYGQDAHEQVAYEQAASVAVPSTDLAPQIDGNLNDPAWATAGRIDNLTGLEPTPGAIPAKRTEVLITMGPEALYIAIIAHDDEPHKIRPSVGERDGGIWKDDHVRIFLDPLLSGRNGYSFEVNALGARREALIADNRRYIDPWDTIWNATARITETGWVAEMEIPYRSIGFQRGRTSWGFQVNRVVPRTNEQMRWQGAARGVFLFDLSKAGQLTGMEKANPPGIGLDVRPVLTMRHIKRYGSAPDNQDFDITPGGHIAYGITPSLTATLTAKPDFSDAPIDQRQVNTGRFALLFPETRDFFLGDANLFQFGGLALQGDMGETQNGQPYFSRRIGIQGGQPVDIPWGFKVAGAAGRTTIGALTAETRSDAAGAEQLSVLRTATHVAETLSLGTLFTYGNARTANDNWLGGLDGAWEGQVLGQRVQIDAFALLNGSADADTQGPAHGLEINLPSDIWRSRLSFKELDAAYFPGIGFANRTGIREAQADTRWRTRWKQGDAGPLRYMDFGTANTLTLDQHNALQSGVYDVYVELGLWPADFVELHGIHRFENIEAPFLVAGRVPVPAGTYRDTRAKAYLYLTPLRPYGGEFSVETGGFYGGTRTTAKALFDMRPSPLFNLSASYTYDDIDLPGGDLQIHIASLDAKVNFTPDMQLALQGEFDTLSSGLVGGLRFRWHVRPQTELFASLTHGGAVENDTLQSNSTESVVRFGNTFRF